MKVISCKRNVDVKLHLNLNLVTNVTNAYTHVRTYGRNITAKRYMPHSPAFGRRGHKKTTPPPPLSRTTRKMKIKGRSWNVALRNFQNSEQVLLFGFVSLFTSFKGHSLNHYRPEKIVMQSLEILMRRIVRAVSSGPTLFAFSYFVTKYLFDFFYETSLIDIMDTFIFIDGDST